MLITGMLTDPGGNRVAGGLSLIVCVFEYMHERGAMAGLVGVSETVR
jgi:hypothetical protein